MGRRASVLLLSVAVVLAAASAGSIALLYRSALRSVHDLLTGRMEWVGAGAVRQLGRGRDQDAALARIAAANELEDAYVVDDRLTVVADARGRTGRPAAIAPLDPARARAALAGRSSIAWGDGSLLGGYFALPADGRPRALLLQAGANFSAPSRSLSVAAATALVVGTALIALALAAIGWAVRSARREKEAFGQAERAGLAAHMAAMVAHEVRNPLGIIRGGAELLKERLGDARDKELADDILGEVDRLNTLTEEFLTLSRDQPLTLADVALGPLARDVCDAVALRYRERPLRFTVDGDATVRGDRVKLRQALINLVLNGAQAVADGGEVRVAIDVVAGRARVRVADDGPGVEPAMAARLFEPFATGKASGTGLGLAVARKIAERHGGALVHVAGDRPGACFELSLPAAAEGA